MIFSWLNNLFGSVPAQVSFSGADAKLHEIRKLETYVASKLPLMPLADTKRRAQWLENYVDGFGLGNRALAGSVRECVHMLARDIHLFQTLRPINYSNLSLTAQSALLIQLQRQRAYIDSPDQVLSELEREMQRLLSPLLSALPDLASETDDDFFQLSVFELLANPTTLLDELVTEALRDEARDGMPAFPTLARTIDKNLEHNDLYETKHGRTAVLMPSQINLSLVGARDAYLSETAFEPLLSARLNFSIPYKYRFMHTHIQAGTGHGKTQLQQNLIYRDMLDPRQPGLIIMDSQNQMIDLLTHLQEFNPRGGSLKDRIVYADFSDVIRPVSINLFDASLKNNKPQSKRDQEARYNALLELYGYMFASLMGAELTAKMGLLFTYSLRVILQVPNANVHTLLDFLQNPSAYQKYIHALGGTAANFFANSFDAKQYEATKIQISQRLYTLLANPTLDRLFSGTRNAIDISEIMAQRKILLINTAKPVLQECAGVIGNLFIALIMQAAFARLSDPSDELPPCFVYIDEFHDYFTGASDIKFLKRMLEQARKAKVGLTFAHQELSQIPQTLVGLVKTTAVRYLGSLSETDARVFASGMNTSPEHLMSFVPSQDHTSFATHVKGVLPRATSLTLSYGTIEAKPRMSDEDYALFISRNQDLVSDVALEAPSAQPLTQHQELQRQLKACAQKLGFVALLEEPVSDGFIDLALFKDDLRLAIEISDTNEAAYEVQNIQKCISAGFSCLMVSEDHQHLSSIKQRALALLDEETLSQVHFFSPAEVETYLSRFAHEPVDSNDRGYSITAVQAQVSQELMELKLYQLARFIQTLKNRRAA